VVNNQYHMSLPLVLSLFSTNHNTTPHQNEQKVVAKVVSQDLFIQLIGYQKNLVRVTHPFHHHSLTLAAYVIWL
jgi:lipase chaperone LimK